MELDGGPDVLVSELQQEGIHSAAVNASRARESNGDVHTALEHPVKQGATEVGSWTLACTAEVLYKQAKNQQGGLQT